MQLTRWIQKYVIDGLRKMDETDLRWSYLIIGGMVVAGIAVNIFMPHGWTVWPFVLAAAIMLLIHEAAERNTEGIPALTVYTVFGGAIALWMIIVFTMSAMNPLILVAGMGVIVYQAAKGIIKDREKRRVIATRRMEGRCIHCGELAGEGVEMCLNCGEEPDPDSTRLKRVQAVTQSLKRTERLRETLAPPPPSAVAAQKEKALLARRQKAQGRLKK